MNWSRIPKCLSILCLSATLLPLAAWSEEISQDPEVYIYGYQIPKKVLDDPVDLFVTKPLKDTIPREIWNQIVFDKDKMKKGTAEMLGFTATDLVGKIAPEIKPGKYTYKSLEEYPGLKGLFPPLFAQHVIKPGGPPLVCNIPEFEIIPTRQFYWFVPLIEATKRNLGKTKLDKDGYIDPWSWEGGVPFPQPSGKFKAQQVLYNFERRSIKFEDCWGFTNENHSHNKNLELDTLKKVQVGQMRFKGRTLFSPYGWYDKRAKRNNEWAAYGYTILEPRNLRATGILRFRYDDPDKMDPAMIYLPNFRRVRKMSGTDTQDPTGDMIYDDQTMFMQKITPKKYPYEYEIIEEREYLQAVSYNSMPTWVDSKNGYALRDVQFTRRPCYVFQMTQLDPNYTYSKRIYYIDKESFHCMNAEYYNQKGQLYRTQYYVGNSFYPECGMVVPYGGYQIQRDHLDQHSTFGYSWHTPADWPRSRFSINYLVKRGK